MFTCSTWFLLFSGSLLYCPFSHVPWSSCVYDMVFYRFVFYWLSCSILLCIGSFSMVVKSKCPLFLFHIYLLLFCPFQHFFAQVYKFHISCYRCAFFHSPDYALFLNVFLYQLFLPEQFFVYVLFSRCSISPFIISRIVFRMSAVVPFLHVSIRFRFCSCYLFLFQFGFISLLDPLKDRICFSLRQN